MSRASSSRNIAGPAIALSVALLAVVGIMASGVLGRGVDPSPSTPPGSPTPVPTASPKPSESPTTGDLKVVLDVATDHDVSVLVTDKTGKLTDAKSGRAGDGMSVRWGDWKVENLDDSTIRLTWVGLPRDEALTLSITETGGTYELGLVQAAPPADSDAIGFDRVLVLSFDEPVSADDVDVTIRDAAA